ncbi:MAG: dephospho-CoA kinase [Ruminococcus sp.]|nr:dephospho-CoA kinase [Ruminococcus sp.]
MSNKDYNLYGLTGPTGAGKSCVSQTFAEQGFAVVDADKIAHKALTDPECKKNLCKAFSERILNPDGSINRPVLGSIAFSCKENTKTLNSITHPVITRLCLETFEDLNSKGYKNIILDAPTLIEAKMDTMCKKVICVLSPKELRLERILKRDSITKEKAMERINAQHPDNFYTEKSHYVIINDKDEETLRVRTLSIIKELL